VRRTLSAGALLALALTGCSGGGSGPAPGSPSGGAAPARLERLARLQPCPTAQPGARPVAGGLPDVTLPCIGSGPSVRLAGLRGGPTVVNVYGTWCRPCGREAGYLSQAAVADRHHVRFLGVDVGDTDADALSYAAATKPPAHYPLVADTSDRVIHAYAAGPPVTVFVAASGRVVHVARGPYPSTAALQADIHRYLGAG
jgi:peroxiredoxin